MARSLRNVFALLTPAALVIACSSGGSSGSGGASSSSSSTGTSTSSSSGAGGAATSSSSSSSSSSGAAPTDQCNNASDEGVIATEPMTQIAGQCAEQNLDLTTGTAAEPATKNCIQSGSKGDGGPGLSNGCTGCFDTAAQCAVMHCIAQCAAAPGGMPCAMCVATNCTPAFETCAGPLPSPDGGASDAGDGGG